jgi:hypothetical protein
MHYYGLTESYYGLNDDKAAWFEYADTCMALHERHYSPDTRVWLPKITFLFWTKIKVSLLTKEMATWVAAFTYHWFSFIISIVEHVDYDCIFFENEEDAAMFINHFSSEILNG